MEKCFMKILYNVEKFDTIESIAQKFNVSASQLIKHNNITNNLPRVLEIPEQKTEFKIIANLKREFVFKGNAESVKSNFSKLGLYCNNLKESVCLFKPKNNEIFVVGVLDTLNSICSKFNVSKEEIIKKNNLKTEKLFIGQMIKL